MKIICENTDTNNMQLHIDIDTKTIVNIRNNGSVEKSITVICKDGKLQVSAPLNCKSITWEVTEQGWKEINK